MVGVLRGFSARFFSRFILPSVPARALHASCAVVWCALACARPAAARVVINELYYDHPGADAGHEFIELAHDGAAVADISGFAIEFHNGAGTGWSPVWRAPDGASIAADGRFLVGGEAVSPAPDAVVALALQNGPDAIRLVDAQGAVLDLVGYGGLDDPAYVETAGVAAVAAGKSIARRADAADTDDNAADFVAAVPTPGRRNVARDDVALQRAPDTPALAASGSRARIRVVVSNLGLADVPAGAVALAVVDSSTTGVAIIARGTNAAVVAPGASEAAAFALDLAAGYHWLRVDARYAADERAGNDAVHLLRRASPVPLVVSEVWSAPRDGCPQFVELFNAGGTAVEIGGFALSDSRARPVRIDADSLRLGPGEWIALSADPARLAACVPGAAAARLIGVDGSWPAFNRAGGAVADSVVVYDAFGIPVDAAGYPGLSTSSAGRSLERIDLFVHDGPAVWRLCDAPAGASPGLPNGAFLDVPAPAGVAEVSPNPFSPAGGEVLRVAIGAAESVARVDVSVFDATGRRVAMPGSASSFPALVVWDGRTDDGAGVPPGLYVVACEWWRADGTRAAVWKAVVGCAASSRP